MNDGSDLGGRRRLGEAIDEGASVASFGDDAAAGPTIALPASPTRSIDACARVLRIEPIGGAAGDMLTAALIDLGAPEATIAHAIAALALPGVQVEVGSRTRHAIVARGVEVVVEAPQPPRDHASIVRLLADSKLDDALRSLAALTFLELAKAEAKVHRVPVATVHFHEVGAVDAIVDVVAACAGLLAIEAREGAGNLGISIAPIPVAGGTARGAHGAIPLPAPATLELLAGLTLADARFAEGTRGETVTPTGAALLRAWSMARPSSSGAWPTMRPIAIGYGAGRRDFADRANVVRLTLGEATPIAQRTTALAQLECNLDDATAEVVACAVEALIDAGALDAWTQSIGMKKGRSALMLSALVPLDRRDAIARTMMAQTTSLGVRWTEVSRVERPRRFVEVATPFGDVRVKIADGDGLPRVVHPELEECRARAKVAEVPVREVIAAAIRAVDSTT